jgi:hypothetical protein
MRGEMHYPVLAQDFAGGRCSIRCKIERPQALSFGREGNNLLSFLSGEGQSWDM